MCHQRAEARLIYEQHLASGAIGDSLLAKISHRLLGLCGCGCHRFTRFFPIQARDIPDQTSVHQGSAGAVTNRSPSHHSSRLAQTQPHSLTAGPRCIRSGSLRSPAVFTQTVQPAQLVRHPCHCHANEQRGFLTAECRAQAS